MSHRHRRSRRLRRRSGTSWRRHRWPRWIYTAAPAPGRSRRRLALLAGTAVLVLLVAAGMISLPALWMPQLEPASPERMAYPLPAKPSIAVLPFAESDQRRRAGPDGRGADRRPHQHARQEPVDLRDRTQFDLRICGPACRDQAGSRGARRALRRRGQHQAGRRPGAGGSATRRCGKRESRVGRALRADYRRSPHPGRGDHGPDRPQPGRADQLRHGAILGRHARARRGEHLPSRAKRISQIQVEKTCVPGSSIFAQSSSIRTTRKRWSRWPTPTFST